MVGTTFWRSGEPAGLSVGTGKLSLHDCSGH